MTNTFEVTDRTQVRRLPARGSYDRPAANAILDEAFVCHIGFVGDDGHPVVIPTNFARDGERLLIHGSPASRMLRTLGDGTPMCVTVTLIDGLVLAKSAFHHSVNYRSVVAFGTATAITDLDDKRRALDIVVEHIVPGRTADARGASDKELRATLVLELPLDEVSVKVRTGGPIDDEEDLALPAWAGVVDVTTSYAAPAEAPDYARNYARPSRTS
ncbi:MAG TPA: pyridoxamine 5'-phosphate oxidase family protein [Acidimicrobiales bacterium]|nr:pyridoxamine 5'-phosphate oxidase family protein [Acidimicrobiales bacterium]